MRQGVKPAVTEIGTQQGVVVFLDKTVVVFVVRAAAREKQVRQFFSQIAQQEVIEELAAIVGMEFDDRKGQARQQVIKAISHGAETAAENGDDLTPAAGHIHHL